jgi:hypothetical protein
MVLVKGREATMAQDLPSYCPRCGAPAVASSRFCTTCGFPAETMLSKGEPLSPKQTIQFNQDQLPEIQQQASQHDPYVQQSYQQASVQAPLSGQQSYSQYVPQSFQERGEHDYSYSPAPKKRSIGRKGCVLLLVALLVLLGTTSYIVAGFLGAPLPGFVVIQPPVTTTAINSLVPYAGLDITVLNVQQSQRFVNDPNSSTNGMVRLNLREQNQTNVTVSWSYENIARLILPDKSIVSPTYVNAKVDIAPGTSQTSVVDFAVPSNDRVSQLTLRLGAANEAQMFIPLTANADVSKYQPMSINLNGQMQYFGLNWTLTSATTSLGIEGRQAASGMRYIIMTLNVVNTLSQIAITGSPYDYIRLKFGNTTVSPKNTTLPVSFDVGASLQAGTVTFLVPQNARSFTLILEPQKGDAGDQASADFEFA